MAKMKDLIVSLVVVAVFCCQLVSGKHEGAKAANEFAVDFSKTVMGAGEAKNLFFSPISVYLAFAMTYAGARNNTAKELERVLKWSSLGSKRHEAIEELIDSVIKSLSENGQTLSLANKLWIQVGYCLTACNKFKNILQQNYDSDIGEINFVRNNNAARQKINKWVEQKTANKIKELIKRGMIDKMTRLVITNAIYFKSNWKFQFKPDDTRTRAFFVTSNNNIRVSMMHLAGKFGYFEDDRYQALELPYAVPEVSMTIFLPRDSNTIAGLQQDFDMNFVNRYVAQLKKKKVAVAIPKFKMTAELELKGIFRSLGVNDLFGDDADLTGILRPRGLYVSDAIHKSYVDVSEEGTEAASATAILMKGRSMHSDVFRFNANHPFIFVIRHIPSSAILFFGQVVKPVA